MCLMVEIPSTRQGEMTIVSSEQPRMSTSIFQCIRRFTLRPMVEFPLKLFGEFFLHVTHFVFGVVQ